MDSRAATVWVWAITLTGPQWAPHVRALGFCAHGGSPHRGVALNASVGSKIWVWAWHTNTSLRLHFLSFQYFSCFDGIQVMFYAGLHRHTPNLTCALPLAGQNTPTPHPEMSRLHQNIKNSKERADSHHQTWVEAHSWWWSRISVVYESIFSYLRKSYRL